MRRGAGAVNAMRVVFVAYLSIIVSGIGIALVVGLLGE
jgi:hypothetical protein